MIKVSAVFEYRGGGEAHNDLVAMIRCATHRVANPHRSLPSLLFIYNMAVVHLENRRPIRCLCSLLVALFTHWSSKWTRFKDEAHLQYKNIVQQSSCHSKHSYLSINGPVTSAAIQIMQKHKQKTEHNLLHRAKIKGAGWGGGG